MPPRLRAAVAVVLLLALLGIAIGVSVGSGSVTRRAIVFERGAADAPASVWIGAGDGTHLRSLGPGSSPLLSPNGELVAASTTSTSGPALILYSAGDGHRLGAFFERSLQTATATAFSPDSRYLAVTLASTNPASNRASGLQIIDTGSRSARLLARGTIYGATFSPDGSDRLTYASAPSTALTAPVNVHVIRPDGSATTLLTRDNRSLYPVWGRQAIAYDRERLRPHADPIYQVWLLSADGMHRRQLTHMPVPALADGLVPLAFSDDGTKLLAQYEGVDTSRGWLLDLPRRSSQPLRLGRHSVSAAAISHDGTRVLGEQGNYLTAPSEGTIVRLTLRGQARASRLVRGGSSPSWNL